MPTCAQTRRAHAHGHVDTSLNRLFGEFMCLTLSLPSRKTALRCQWRLTSLHAQVCGHENNQDLLPKERKLLSKISKYYHLPQWVSASSQGPPLSQTPTLLLERGIH